MDDVDTVEEKEQLVKREMLGLVAKMKWEGVSLFGTEGSDQHQTEAKLHYYLTWAVCTHWKIFWVEAREPLPGSLPQSTAACGHTTPWRTV